jgi:Cu/Ag efflux protein CusF
LSFGLFGRLSKCKTLWKLMRRHQSAMSCVFEVRERALEENEVLAMGKGLNAAAAAVILVAATTAFAAEPAHKTTGRIKSIDLLRHIVTLEDGSTFKAERGVNIKRLKTGEKVTVTTSRFGGMIEASAITPTVD